MEAIEFKTKIRNGMIHVPKNIGQKFNKTVKVILITEHEAAQTDMIDELLTNPLHSENFVPFSRNEIHERI